MLRGRCALSAAKVYPLRYPESVRKAQKLNESTVCLNRIDCSIC